MAEIIKKGDEVGRILVQVQNDLSQLRKRLGRIDHDGTLDVQVLDEAISRTEDGIKNRAEEYLKTVNKQVLTLPIIEHVEKKAVTVAKWQPPTESIPYIAPQKYLTAGSSPGEKHKAAFTMRALYNPDHPKHRDLMHQNYGLQLPDLLKKPGPTVGTQKAKSSTVAVVPIDQNRYLLPAASLCEEDKKPGKNLRIHFQGHPTTHPSINAFVYPFIDSPMFTCTVRLSLSIYFVLLPREPELLAPKSGTVLF
ncbi:IQ motif-containing protein H [Ictalurus punctatus]|uniref:IQ motif-containing protein H n=1 Tax=Ictalurus punctatus TaxID=7998 RepID=A0A9F7REL7_ICTPU|nr:IQ motif-containing protein H [Ictalurus punctatus]